MALQDLNMMLPSRLGCPLITLGTQPPPDNRVHAQGQHGEWQPEISTGNGLRAAVPSQPADTEHVVQNARPTAKSTSGKTMVLIAATSSGRSPLKLSKWGLPH